MWRSLKLTNEQFNSIRNVHLIIFMLMNQATWVKDKPLFKTLLVNMLFMFTSFLFLSNELWENSMFFIKCIKEIKCCQHTILSNTHLWLTQWFIPVILGKNPLLFCFQNARLIDIFISELAVQFCSFTKGNIRKFMRK